MALAYSLACGETRHINTKVLLMTPSSQLSIFVLNTTWSLGMGKDFEFRPKRRHSDKAEKSCVRQFVADHIIMEVRQRLYLVYLQF